MITRMQLGFSAWNDVGSHLRQPILMQPIRRIISSEFYGLRNRKSEWRYFGCAKKWEF
jgi:hypothetical protein